MSKLELYQSKNQKKLRCGITTGTCAAASAGAAASFLLQKTEKTEVTLMVPKGVKVTVDVEKIKAEELCCTFGVYKDSGDDPDVTNGTLVCVSLQIFESDRDILALHRNAFVCEDNPGLFLDGGVGIGRVTKEGLEQKIGQAAINPVPRRMIFDAVQTVVSECEFEKPILILVEIPEGEELAKKTFNPKLGIQGGLSVLGTGGILIPMSNEAIVDTMETEIRMRKAADKKVLYLAPGNYGVSYLSTSMNLPKEEIVECSNYIGEALDFAVSYGFEEVVFAGDIGKLCKMAFGIMNTHSKVADARAEVFALEAMLQGGDLVLAEKLMECVSTKAMLDVLFETEYYDAVVSKIIDKIFARMKQRCGSLKCRVMVFSMERGLLGERVDEE